MKIYTKTGDKGETSLIGGYRVSKSDLRIESYGTVDELNSWLGLLANYLPNERIEEMQNLQALLFSAGAMLASKSKEQKRPFTPIDEQDILALEACIDDYENFLPAMTHFILPGGSKAAAQTHIARCVCRRAERIVVQLSRVDYVDKQLMVFLNRLSDYLFCLARAFTHWDGTQEIKWIPTK
ncbi:MAG: cob(I)yrinic acid a,c-diamide adenosyltransferase [Flavobacteriaceae bacterium]